MAAPISAAPHSFSLMDNVSSSIGLMLFASHLRLGDRPDTKTRRAHVWLGYTTNGPPGGRRIQSRLETTGAIPDLIGVTAPTPPSWGPTWFTELDEPPANWCVTTMGLPNSQADVICLISSDNLVNASAISTK
jgi:hypothetical protein